MTTTTTKITLDQLHQLVGEAYAVCLNDTLYFVGYDDNDYPYIADNDGYDYVSLAEVDGDIECTDRGLFFYVAGEPITLKLLVLHSEHIHHAVKLA